MTTRRTKLCFLLPLAITALTVTATAASAQARCFEPLTQRNKRDPSDFKDLEVLGIPSDKLPPKASGVIGYLPPSSGKDDINIDFLWVTFTRPQGVDAAAFFREIRGKYPAFAKGQNKKFAFGPYEDTFFANDIVRQINADKWMTQKPIGALMSFNLGSVIPWARVTSGTAMLGEKNGDVQVVCATDLDFVFATVETKRGGMHPVAGYRGFGLMADPGGTTWTFYSKAIDRDSGFSMNKVLRKMRGDNAVFCMGNAFWVEFFGQFRSFIEQEGLKVVDWDLSNNGPVTYPLGNGSGPWKPLDCGLENKPKKQP
jgi:hypothetical protein